MAPIALRVLLLATATLVPTASLHAADRADGDASIAQRATRADAEQVWQQFEQLIAAYERGDLAAFDRGFAPSTMGLQALRDALLFDAAARRLPRLRFTDTQLTASPELAVIQTRWEKRWLDPAGLAPEASEGQVTLLLKREDQRWQISAIQGDNPFIGPRDRRAQLRVGAVVVALAALPQTCPVVAPPPVTGPVSGTASGVLTVPASLIGATGTLSGTVMGARLGSVPVSVGFSGAVLPLTPTAIAAGPVSVPVTVALTGTAAGPVAGPFAVTAGGSVSAPFSFVDVASGALRTTLITGIVTVTVTAPGLPLPPCVPVPLPLELRDAARAGQGNVRIEATTAQGDREVLLLRETSPGRFVLNAVPLARAGAVSVGNRYLEVLGPTQISLRYVDTAAASLTEVLRIQ